MAYIIERKNRFYVVAYDGPDPSPARNDGDGTPPAGTVTTPKRWPPASNATPPAQRRGEVDRSISRRA